MSVLSFEKLEEAYIKSYENATELVEEAKLLFDNNKYARAYFLAQIAYEELAKLPIILHEAIRSHLKEKQDWKKFYKRLNSHSAKNTLNVVFSQFPYLDIEEVEKNAENLNTLKNASLYSDLNETNYVKPSELVTKESALARIGTVESFLLMYTKSKLHIKGEMKKVFSTEKYRKQREKMKEIGLI
ncbi:hypothetical protein J22TS1_21560 [Siminovitchia terrae]|uniref:AbiV family abortive infection protein n=1 Tax=Siminovitchia terrae TaxID=1914933 RepID=UPI001B2BFCCD|nr:AbiV family abortive infection protein [Siminovitchia terrae]GIN91105.1 hypothetical protein J22TS1_21560 [Siminovitchia terrae]